MPVRTAPSIREMGWAMAKEIFSFQRSVYGHTTAVREGRTACYVQKLRATTTGTCTKYVVRIFFTPAAVPSGPLHPSYGISEGARDGVVAVSQFTPRVATRPERHGHSVLAGRS